MLVQVREVGSSYGGWFRLDRLGQVREVRPG